MKTLAVGLIPVALFVATMVLLRWIQKAPAPRWPQIERVLYHVVGIGSLGLTGVLLLAAYYVRDGGLSLVMAAIATIPGINAVRYLTHPTRRS